MHGGPIVCCVSRTSLKVNTQLKRDAPSESIPFSDGIPRPAPFSHATSFPERGAWWRAGAGFEASVAGACGGHARRDSAFSETHPAFLTSPCRPFRAGPRGWSRSPGRCPGLVHGSLSGSGRREEQSGPAAVPCSHPRLLRVFVSRSERIACEGWSPAAGMTEVPSEPSCPSCPYPCSSVVTLPPDDCSRAALSNPGRSRRQGLDMGVIPCNNTRVPRGSARHSLRTVWQ